MGFDVRREPLQGDLTPETPLGQIFDAMSRPVGYGNPPKGWQTWRNVRSVMQGLANRESALLEMNVFDDPETLYTDTAGIVIGCGGKYWDSAYITARMVRATGCHLPIELWYFRESERSEFHEQAIAKVINNVSIHCVESHPLYRVLFGLRGGLHGYGAKLFSVMQSPHRRVLWLDADCYPCQNISIIFDACERLRTPALYWPDLPHTEAWTHWEFWGVKQRGPKCGLETGVYYVDKWQSYKPLRLAQWYEYHWDWCYGGGDWSDHGDKGPHRVAFAKLNQDLHVMSLTTIWDRVAFLHPGVNGETAFVHRVGSKFSTDSRQFYSPQLGANMRCGFPGEEFAFTFLDELKYLRA